MEVKEYFSPLWNNPWGKAWGNKGFGYFSFNYAENKMWAAMGTDLVPEIVAE